MVIFFLGVRTDRIFEFSLTWKHVGTQKISTHSSKLRVSCRSLYASPNDGDAYSDSEILIIPTKDPQWLRVHNYKILKYMNQKKAVVFKL